jgi:predicted nucleic acid-binding protein
MSRIFWDTNLFIYLFEAEGPLHARAVELRKAMLERGDQLLTSALTLGEILVKPIERGDAALAARYEEAVAATALIITFDVPAAKVYASLRRDRSIRPPDAIQLACASAANVDLFITNDDRLGSKRVEGIQFVVPLGRAPL